MTAYRLFSIKMFELKCYLSFKNRFNRRGREKGWAIADKSGRGERGSILAHILQTSFMDDPLLRYCR